MIHLFEIYAIIYDYLHYP